jgi:hypothetical protein
VLKKTLLVLIAVLVLAQAYRPEKTNPPVDPTRSYHAHLQVSPEVARVFERSCKDCHSHETVWPWYSQVAPVSWMIASDVREARKHMNLSEWGSYSPKKARGVLAEICEVMEGDEMPLWSYRIMHSGTRLNESERKMVCAWAESQRAVIESRLGTENVPAESHSTETHE